jgi:Mor family transcriptional regulator
VSGDRLAEIKARPHRTIAQWESDLGWLVREVEQLRGDLIRRYRADIETDELVRRYQAGERLRDLAGAYHVGAETVRRRLLKQNVLRARGPSRRDDLPEGAIVADYLDGCSVTILGKRYGCAPATIRRILTENGIPLRGRAEARRRRATT